MSAPSSPGEASKVSASRSAATMASAPLSRSDAIAGLMSRTAPDVSGYCSRPPNTSRSGKIGADIAHNKRPSQRLGAGAQHGKRLRMHLAIDKEGFRLHLR